MASTVSEDDTVKCRWCGGWFPRWSMTQTRKGMMCDKCCGDFEDSITERQEAAESRERYSGLSRCEDGS